MYKKADYDFYLPQELIAQSPSAKRDESRLMLLDARSGTVSHDTFDKLYQYLSPKTLLVRNNTKVIPARLFANKITGARIELLLIERLADTENRTVYEVLAKPARRLHIKDKLFFDTPFLMAEVIEKKSEKIILEFKSQGVFEDVLYKIGQIPLPKYIKKELYDKDRYQTIYAKSGESAAAPTAGLHFTDELFRKIKSKGIEIVDLNLNIGLGTFAPVRTDNLKEHKMHKESFSISKKAAEKINNAKENSYKILAIGTTTVRALESAWDNKANTLKYGDFETDIFIYPGYKFKVVDSLVTNFHLPKSTLLMLVSALAGRENILHAYNEAVKEKYRFFSFGDAMFIK